MIATHNQQTPKDNLSLNSTSETNTQSTENETAVSKIKNINASSQLVLPSRIITHNPKAGLNPIVDAAGYLFSVLGKLKNLTTYRQLSKLQKELIQEITVFQETIQHHNYNAEYIVVCRYALCATFDDIIANTAWGGHGQWESLSLLSAFNQDTQHQNKFFTILERAIKEPTHYIDLMEFMYICLSMGYKGQYRSTEHSQYQLEQIINTLYKHIRVYRGSFSKTLSPMPLKQPKSSANAVTKRNLSPLFIFFITSCIIMTIFVSLGYLMDVISNEAYKYVTQIESPVLDRTPKQ